MLKILNIVACFTCLAGLVSGGCATDISSGSYSDEHVGEAGRSYSALVVRVRQVKVAPDQLGKSYTGAVVGGVGGGFLGSQFGSGVGNVLMTAGGAIAGAAIGASAERRLKTQTGLEITVKLENGEMRTVVQGNDVSFRRGDRVFIIIYDRGRSKIVKEDA